MRSTPALLRVCTLPRRSARCCLLYTGGSLRPARNSVRCLTACLRRPAPAVVPLGRFLGKNIAAGSCLKRSLVWTKTSYITQTALNRPHGHLAARAASESADFGAMHRPRRADCLICGLNCVSGKPRHAILRVPPVADSVKRRYGRDKVTADVSAKPDECDFLPKSCSRGMLIY